MNDSGWMSEGLAKLGLVEWPEMPPPSSACLRYRLDQLLRYISTGPEMGRNFVKWPMAALINVQRRAEEKYKNLCLLSSLAIYKWAKQMQIFFCFFSSIYIADFWQKFFVISENGSNWSNLRLNVSISTLGSVEITQNNTSSPSFHNVYVTKSATISLTFHVCSKYSL